jgi:hypothetical protein
MLDHVDEFRPVHNINAMADLVSALGERNAEKADPRRYL